MLANHHKGLGITGNRADDTNLTTFAQVFSAVGTKLPVDANRQLGLTGVGGGSAVAHNRESAGLYDIVLLLRGWVAEESSFDQERVKVVHGILLGSVHIHKVVRTTGTVQTYSYLLRRSASGNVDRSKGYSLLRRHLEEIID